ncbi:MAG: HAMP domain-containing histidine kinase, partial [Gorillibacterium sp.]|nr:HAMP domain-containing histidine kinase [Gorillibacterium sp.]
MNSKKFNNRLTFRLFAQFSYAVILFTIGMVLLILAVTYMGRLGIAWFDWEDRYNILHASYDFFNRYKIFAFFLFWCIGVLLISLYYLRRVVGFVGRMVNTIDGLFEPDTDLIQLPNELKDVEEQLNQLKYDVMRNQQLAKDAEQRKNDLVVYLAHDLKTPLTSVIGYMTLLRDERQISEELRDKYLSISVDKAERLEELINEFFEITRFNLTGLTLEKTKINLTRMLEQISDEFKPLLTPKHLSCS